MTRFWTSVFLLFVLSLGTAASVQAQGQNSVTHERGRIWDVLWNNGYIGSAAAWDYGTSEPLGLFPGFSGFQHPIGGEENAINTYANANMHNFRSGVWILARNLQTPGQPPNFTPQPTDYEFYAAGAQGNVRGTLSELPPIELQKNYLSSESFNPLLPEEWTEATWPTNTGITVTRRSYVWSYPGYENFIVYDYIFKNTGDLVSNLTSEVVPNTEDFQQTLEDVYFAFHSGVSVSTKSQINFHSELSAVQAGAFGWKPPYHDYYELSDDNTLAFSYNYNGGSSPPPFDSYPKKDDQAWKQQFGDELQSPAAFGWLALYAAPINGGSRTTPAPDVLRIDDFKRSTLGNEDLDLEFFKTQNTPPQKYYEFATSSTRQEQLGNTGDRFNFYTFSYGPYTLAPGDSVRFTIAEIAGVMDYKKVVAGDTTAFPDSSIAAIKRNAELARQAVRWGRGASVDGVPVAADVPEPPPAPETEAVNASRGQQQAAIGVTWGDIAESKTISDGSGGVFYDGESDLDGYRVYRSTDFQYTSANQEPAFRGAAWTLLEDIPKSEFDQYWNADLGKYQFVDDSVSFGRRYGYYVAAYNADPGPWTSANGTLVEDLPELASGSHNRSEPASAVAGPVASLDVYAVPNPFVFGSDNRSFGRNNPYRVEFRNLSERATIRIYTVAGDLVRTIRHGPDESGNLSGTATWDQESDSGLLVAPGVYIYHVDANTENVQGEKTGKLMIIR